MVGMPWGDISTAWRTTGIPNIAVLMSLMRGAPLVIRQAGFFRSLLQSSFLQRWCKAIIQRWVTGPDASYRDTHQSEFIAIASDDVGNCCSSYLRIWEVYAFTGAAACEVAMRVLAGNARPGYHTPGDLFGPDFVLDIAGSRRKDMPTTR